MDIICKYWTDFHREVIAPIYEDIFRRYVNGNDVLPILPVSFITPKNEILNSPDILRITNQFVIDEKYIGISVV